MSVKNYDWANQENLFAQTNQDSTISNPPSPLKKKKNSLISGNQPGEIFFILHPPT